MPVNSLLVESIDLRRLGGATGRSDAPCDRFDRRQFAPGEKDLCPLVCEGACDAAADVASGAIDHCNFVLQHHLLFLSVLGLEPSMMQTPRRRENGRAPTAW